jgi:hypothetical protein
MASVALYVDGFNLFYGMLDGNPDLKWLDLEALGRALRPSDELVKVRYCTANVSALGAPQRPARQQTYLRALRSLPLVEVTFGRFETRQKTRRLVHPAPGQDPDAFAQDPEVLVYHTEEKGSDVNLATHLILDGVDGLWEQAVVISNDSDLESPIRECNTRFGPVHIVSPYAFGPGYQNYSTELRAASASYTCLQRTIVEASQLPDPVCLASGKLMRRPANWH